SGGAGDGPGVAGVPRRAVLSGRAGVAAAGETDLVGAAGGAVGLGRPEIGADRATGGAGGRAGVAGEAGWVAGHARRARAAGAGIAIQIRSAGRAVGEIEAGVPADLHAGGAVGQPAVARVRAGADGAVGAAHAGPRAADLI